jgi:hypothetical protein
MRSLLILKVTGTKLWRKFPLISYHPVPDGPLSFYFRACGITVDGTRVDFPPKSNSDMENVVDIGKASESEMVLVEEEIRPPAQTPFSDEKAPIDVSAVVSVESDNTNTNTPPQLVS